MKNPDHAAVGPIPVMFLVPTLHTGGAERQLCDLVTRLDRKRIEPVVVCQKDGGRFYDEIRDGGVPAHALGFRGRLDPRYPWRLARLCRRYGIRVLVVRSLSTGMVGRLVARSLGIKVISAEHSTGIPDPDPRRDALRRILGPRTDGVIAVAHGQIPYLVRERNFQEHKIRVIHNGIQLSDWPPVPRDPELLRELDLPPDAPVAGILAMLRPEKDHETFLEASALVRRTLPDAHFLVVGDGPCRARLEEKASELGLQRHVRFTGVRKDVARLVALFDVSVLTSTTVETFPMSFLEAMAMERPLVGTRVGGVPEMIEDRVNGRLVPLRSPEAVAAALVEILSDPELARSMGKRSRAIVEERFTMEKMVRETEAYLESFVPEPLRVQS